MNANELIDKLMLLSDEDKEKEIRAEGCCRNCNQEIVDVQLSIPNGIYVEIITK